MASSDANNSRAVGRVIQQQRHRVYTLAYYTLGSHPDAEDATQETLIRLWRNASKIDLDRVEGWLVRTTTNVCIDLVRKRKRSRESFGSEQANTLLQAAVAGTPEPSDRAATAESREQVERELSLLDEPYRSLLILREVQGLPYNAIAAALDMPLTSVRVYLHRARRKLAARLTPNQPRINPKRDNQTAPANTEAYAHDV